MKFLADLGISPRTVNWLKSVGYDAVHLVDEGLERLPDDEILVKARFEGRILLTVDLDAWLFIGSKWSYIAKRNSV